MRTLLAHAGSPAWQWQNPLAAALAAVFLLAGSADAVALHRCPHHHPAPLSGDTAAHVGHVGHDAPADPEGPCQCIGDCHSGTSVIIGAAPAARSAIAVGVLPADHARPTSHIPLPPSHFLPFANGPPISRRA